MATKYYRFELWTHTNVLTVSVTVDLAVYVEVRRVGSRVTAKNTETGINKTFNLDATTPFAYTSVELAKSEFLHSHRRPAMLLSMWDAQLAKLVDQAIAEYNG